ncbi:hypothetical protein [Massilia sp. NR 4-1]|uniref:hypothetical protein n=1 Tax=Massilia sp. NR 4-1 TaxID=1678028 RepID=UPI00067C8A19|nr:hypothetical protein [Massilia sp. NR 4-1]AKU24508.1 hypothetical protein ACZ75_26620 [Massilia sp. NR 4-1]
MSESETQELSLALDEAMKHKLLLLAQEQGVLAQRLMQQAVTRYLAWLDGLSVADRAAALAWQDYQQTGLHLSEAEADVWLAELEAGNASEPRPYHS